MHSTGKRLILFLILGIVFTGAAHSENIRGKLVGTLDLDGAALGFLPEQLVAVSFDAQSKLLSGIEVSIEIPTGLQNYQNSFALMMYRNITPAPSTENHFYSGTRAYMRLLPTRNSTFIRIPFEKGHGITGDALTDVVPAAIPSNQFPLLITVLPVMKGIPDNAFTNELKIKISPIWKNQGLISVRIANPSGNPDEQITASIDGKDVPLEQPFMVSAGLHRIRVRSSHAPTTEKTIAIEPGQSLTIDWTLDYSPPEITISIPLGSTILLDGEEVLSSSPAMVLKPNAGDHVITYKIGEWEISRRFTILPGAKLAIDLLVEIDIVEYGEGSGSEFGAGDGSR